MNILPNTYKRPDNNKFLLKWRENRDKYRICVGWFLFHFNCCCCCRCSRVWMIGWQFYDDHDHLTWCLSFHPNNSPSKEIRIWHATRGRGNELKPTDKTPCYIKHGFLWDNVNTIRNNHIFFGSIQNLNVLENTFTVKENKIVGNVCSIIASLGWKINDLLAGIYSKSPFS